MMDTQWQRLCPFGCTNFHDEEWVCQSFRADVAFKVRVTYGKNIDIVQMKQKELANFDERTKWLRQTNMAVFSSDHLETVGQCPICKREENFQTQINIYGADYVRCSSCEHRFVKKRLSTNYIKQYYAESETYQAVYTDKDLLWKRIESIVEPKLAWAIKEYETHYGRKPENILDVGAGSGHFVAAARREGYQADGVEISRSGIEFARNNFGVDLKNVDFVACPEALGTFDMITFWGCVEHVPDPMQMLMIAKSKLNREGMVIVELPRWDSISTKVQMLFPDQIIRHLVPNAHLHLFTDSSAATALFLSHLKPVAAWYFGMDAYEATVQILKRYSNLKAIQSFKDYIQKFQEIIDLHGLADSIVLAGVSHQ